MGCSCRTTATTTTAVLTHMDRHQCLSGCANPLTPRGKRRRTIENKKSNTSRANICAIPEKKFSGQQSEPKPFFVDSSSDDAGVSCDACGWTGMDANLNRRFISKSTPERSVFVAANITDVLRILSLTLSLNVSRCKMNEEAFVCQQTTRPPSEKPKQCSMASLITRPHLSDRVMRKL